MIAKTLFFMWQNVDFNVVKLLRYLALSIEPGE